MSIDTTLRSCYHRQEVTLEGTAINSLPIFYLATADLEQQISRLSLKTVLIASIILIACTVLASLTKKQKMLKLPLFLAMAGSLIVSTAILFGSTIYLNNRSESKGPVHWHADIEFWACDVEFELRNPSGTLSNKVGTSTYHEHNDKRIHLEGVVVKKIEDASLEKFMRVTGGYLAKDRIAIPLNPEGNDFEEAWFASAENGKIDGDKQKLENTSLAIGSMQWIEQTPKGPVVVLKNGERCSGANEVPAQVQVFVYSYNKADKTYSQRKLKDPTEYVLRDEAIVPPGDCVIVEFDSPRDKTNKLCQQYGVRDADRCTEFGVKQFTPELCNISEIDSGLNTSDPCSELSPLQGISQECDEYMNKETN